MYKKKITCHKLPHGVYEPHLGFLEYKMVEGGN